MLLEHRGQGKLKQGSSIHVEEHQLYPGGDVDSVRNGVLMCPQSFFFCLLLEALSLSSPKGSCLIVVWSLNITPYKSILHR